MGAKIALTTCLVFVGCCANIVALEKLVTSVSGVANLITFLQFVFIAAQGFVFTSKFGTRSSKIPLRDCALLVLLFFVASVCNNYAYNLNVPNTLHIIVKSGSIVANMAMGISFKGRKYPYEKYAAAVFIAIGITLCTTASAKNPHITDSEFNFTYWCLGVALLVFALLIGAGMGLLQESLYARCGKHSDDVLFYTHLLPLPLFSFLWGDLVSAAGACSRSQPVNVYFTNIPLAWLLIFANVVTQFICIQSVYTLTSECTSLTVTLVVTLRKFFSLVFSVFFFNNAFTYSHWLGSIFVFSGTLLFFDVVKFTARPKPTQKTE